MKIMKQIRVFSGAFLLLAFLAAMFITLAYQLKKQQLYHFDLSAIQWVQSFICSPLTLIMKFFTWVGSAEAVAPSLILAMFWLLRHKKRWEASTLLMATLGGTILNALIKHIFQRVRPAIHPLITETGYSFPSGHSMNAIIFYGILGYFLSLSMKSKIAKWVVLILTGMLVLFIGISRVYLGVHYPSDVLAGFAAGGVWFIICLTTLKRLKVKTKGYRLRRIHQRNI